MGQPRAPTYDESKPPFVVLVHTDRADPRDTNGAGVISLNNSGGCKYGWQRGASSVMGAGGFPLSCANISTRSHDRTRPIATNRIEVHTCSDICEWNGTNDIHTYEVTITAGHS